MQIFKYFGNDLSSILEKYLFFEREYFSTLFKKIFSNSEPYFGVVAGMRSTGKTFTLFNLIKKNVRG